MSSKANHDNISDDSAEIKDESDVEEGPLISGVRGNKFGYLNNAIMSKRI